MEACLLNYIAEDMPYSQQAFSSVPGLLPPPPLFFFFSVGTVENTPHLYHTLSSRSSHTREKIVDEYFPMENKCVLRIMA